MSFLSKAWKGIKKAVKKTAKRIKNIAKKVITAVPGGKKLWELGGKIGTKIMKGIGKITNKLGPVGMIALSVLAPYAAPLWSSFGAAAAASSSVWGSIGTAIYNGANWVGATMSSMTSGISKAIGNIASGSFGKAADSVVSGFADAFTGKAGAAGIDAGIKAASDFAIKEAAGQSLLDQTVSKITGDVAGDSATQTLADVNKTIDKNIIDLNPDLQGAAGQEVNFNMTKFDVNKATDFSIDSLSKQGAEQLAPQTLETQASNVIKGKASSDTGSSLLSKAGKIGKALLSNDSSVGVQDQQTVGDVGGNFFQGNTQGMGGRGSAGGSFLSQAMLNAMQQQQQRMSRGFG